MSITADLRNQRRGQKEKLQEQRASIEYSAQADLRTIIMYSDSTQPITMLDTARILSAAERLHENKTALNGLDRTIAEINEFLHG